MRGSRRLSGTSYPGFERSRDIFGEQQSLPAPIVVCHLLGCLAMAKYNVVYLVIFLLLVTFVYWAYDNFGALSPIHPINWLLSYCTFALFMAALARLVIDAFKFLRRSWTSLESSGAWKLTRIVRKEDLRR
jgi:hypothetical protein